MISALFADLSVCCLGIIDCSLYRQSRNHLKLTFISVGIHRCKVLRLCTSVFVLEPGVAPQLNATMPVSDRTNSSFAVHWQPPHNCTFLNGYLYKYRFQLIGHNSSMLLREGITHLTSAYFSGLTPHTMYTVRVYLVTSGGWNPKHPLEIPAWTRATS